MQPSSSTIRPGQTASYVIWAWAVGRASNAAVVHIRAAQAIGLTGPRFTVCPSAGSTSCSVGSLSVYRSDELAASVSVGSQAVGGERLELTATVSAAGVRSASASGVVDVITPTAGDPSGQLSPTALALGSAGGDIPPLLNLPGVSPVNPTALFPSVSPPSGSGLGRPPASRRRSHIEAVTTGAVVPMTTLVGAQVVGLAVLVGAVAMVFVRISLRAPRPSGGPDKPQRSSVRRLARRPGRVRRWGLRARRT